MFNLNPIEVLKQREVKILPVHFSKSKISDSEFFEGDIEHWIKTKLKGRYCIVRSPSLENDGKLKSTTFVAFEDQKELTYFMLACPYLRRN
jgi:hypothetical protein